MTDPIEMPPAINPETKAKILEWLKYHPDVWHKDENGVCHFWWVQNLLSTIGIDLYADKELFALLREKM